MHVIIVDTVMTTPPTGGAHTFLVGLCSGLVERGHSVTIVTQPGPEKALIKSLREAGAAIRDDLWSAAHLPEERAARLAKWVNGVRPEVYIVSVSRDAGWLALPFLESSISTFTIVHSDGPAFYTPLKHYRTLLDGAIGVSKETHQKIVAECHVPADRAFRIPYGVTVLSRSEMEARCMAGAEDLLRIGYVGRLVQSQKRVLDFIPLARELEKRELSCELHVIGDGPERASLETGLKGLRMGGGATFWGWLGPAELGKRLRQLDALLLFSDCEGLPIALLEAMGHAVVPVVTKLESGTAEVVSDGINGFLVNVGDIPAFGHRLEKLSSDHDQLAAMKRAAWETGQAFTTDRMVEDYLDCFQQITAASRSRVNSVRAGAEYPVMASCVSRYPFWIRKIKRYFIASAEAAQLLVNGGR
jgi:glycosyltransferase involved in cell wall biosynthesis